MISSVLVGILSTHLLGAMLFFAFRFGRLNRRKEYILPILLIPVFGPLMAISIDLLTAYGKGGAKKLEIGALKFEDNIYWNTIDKLRDNLDSVPLEEAILLDDFAVRRKALQDTFLYDSFGILDVLMLARHNEDVDTTHYATIQITRIERQFQLEIQRLSASYEKDNQNAELLDEYIDLLGKYIDSPLPEDLILTRQQAIYAQLLDKKLSIHKYDQSTLVRKLRHCIRMKNNYPMALELLDLIQKNWPENEQTWIEALRLCVEWHDYERLQQTIREIQSANINWTKQGRVLVSPWILVR